MSKLDRRVVKFPSSRFVSFFKGLTVNSLLRTATVLVFAAIGSLFLFSSHAATPTTPVEAENGAVSGASVVSDSTASGSGAVKFGTSSGGGTATGFPDATNRPHMTSAMVMAYSDASGVAQTVTLKPLPAPGSSFGSPSGCAYYDPRGWVQPMSDNCTIDGYDFNGIGIGQVWVNNFVVSRNWFHNIDGQDSWAVWVHADGKSHSGLTLTDNIIQGTSTSKTGPDGILKADGTTSNIVIERNHAFNTSSFVQFTPIVGSGTTPYGNIVADNYIESISDPSDYGLHLEDINVSAGTGGLLIQHNHITGPSGQTATIYICHDAGNVGNITIDDNLLDGKPQNTIYGGDTGASDGSLSSTAGNIKITNNQFANTSGQNPGGLVIEPEVSDKRISASGNVSYPSLSPIAGM